MGSSSRSQPEVFCKVKTDRKVPPDAHICQGYIQKNKKLLSPNVASLKKTSSLQVKEDFAAKLPIEAF